MGKTTPTSPGVPTPIPDCNPDLNPAMKLQSHVSADEARKAKAALEQQNDVAICKEPDAAKKDSYVVYTIPQSEKDPTGTKASLQTSITASNKLVAEAREKLKSNCIDTVQAQKTIKARSTEIDKANSWTKRSLALPIVGNIMSGALVFGLVTHFLESRGPQKAAGAIAAGTQATNARYLWAEAAAFERLKAQNGISCGPDFKNTARQAAINNTIRDWAAVAGGTLGLLAVDYGFFTFIDKKPDGAESVAKAQHEANTTVAMCEEEVNKTAPKTPVEDINYTSSSITIAQLEDTSHSLTTQSQTLSTAVEKSNQAKNLQDTTASYMNSSTEEPSFIDNWVRPLLDHSATGITFGAAVPAVQYLANNLGGAAAAREAAETKIRLAAEQAAAQKLGQLLKSGVCEPKAGFEKQAQELVDRVTASQGQTVAEPAEAITRGTSEPVGRRAPDTWGASGAEPARINPLRGMVYKPIAIPTIAPQYLRENPSVDLKAVKAVAEPAFLLAVGAAVVKGAAILAEGAGALLEGAAACVPVFFVIPPDLKEKDSDFRGGPVS